MLLLLRNGLFISDLTQFISTSRSGTFIERVRCYTLVFTVCNGFGSAHGYFILQNGPIQSHGSLLAGSDASRPGLSHHTVYCLPLRQFAFNQCSMFECMKMPFCASLVECCVLHNIANAWVPLGYYKVVIGATRWIVQWTNKGFAPITQIGSTWLKCCFLLGNWMPIEAIHQKSTLAHDAKTFINIKR